MTEFPIIVMFVSDIFEHKSDYYHLIAILLWIITQCLIISVLAGHVVE